MTGRRKVRLANGREASALDIQQEYLTRARDFVDRREIETPVIARALDLWERALKAVESEDFSLVEREIDWVHLKLNDQAQRTVLCKDPFRAYDERVQRLIDGM